MDFSALQLQTTVAPHQFSGVAPVPLTDATLQERKEKLLARMAIEDMTPSLFMPTKSTAVTLNT